MVLELVVMELKVWVDGIQRVVCGVSEQTTCQEVVIALAQAIGEFPGTEKQTGGGGGGGPGVQPCLPSQEGGVGSALLFLQPGG